MVKKYCYPDRFTIFENISHRIFAFFYIQLSNFANIFVAGGWKYQGVKHWVNAKSNDFSFILIAIVRLKGMNEKYEALDRFRKDYSELLKVFPDFMEGIWDTIGDKFLDLEKYEDAVLCYDLAIKNNTAINDTYFYKGFALQHLCEYFDAYNCFMEDLKKSPKNPNTLYNIACCLSKLGSLQESIKYLRRAIKYDSTCREDAKDDPSFERVRHLDEFNQILNQ